MRKFIAGYLLFLMVTWVFFVDTEVVKATAVTIIDLSEFQSGYSEQKPTSKSEPKSELMIYVVEKGDAIEKIARRFTILQWQLREANGMEADETLIYPGQELIIPKVEWKAYEGLASWYGDDFHGKMMANGETYDQYEISVAHRIFPLGMKVRITSLVNGKSIIAKVRDRGPFTKKNGDYHREIDLSRGAAEALGSIDDGLIPVLIEPLV